MGLSIAYRSDLMDVIHGDSKVKTNIKKVKAKSLYTIAREAKFKRAALKKYAAEIAEIQKYFPGWEPI